MFTTHGHWFEPTLPGEQAPPMVARCAGPAGCGQCYAEWLVHQQPQPTPAAVVEALRTPPGVAPGPKSDSRPRVAIDPVRDWYQRYRDLKDQAKRLDDEIDQAKVMMLECARRVTGTEDLENVDLTVGGHPVLSYKTVVQRRVDTKRLKLARPDIAEEFTTESVQRRLDIL